MNKFFSLTALFALTAIAVLMLGCVQQNPAAVPSPSRAPAVSPTSAPSASPVACFTGAGSCCVGTTCSVVNIDCVQGKKPVFKGCSADCVPMAECAPEASPTVAPTATPSVAPSASPSPVACTMEAKICPDGSAVGRVGPDCAFAPCPSVTPKPSCPPITISCWCPGLERVSCPTKRDAQGCTQWDIDACLKGS